MWTIENTQGLRKVTGGTLRPGGFDITDRALGFCGLGEGSRVLDAGCGLAATARHLTDRYGMEAFGVDASGSLLAAARGCHGSLPLVGAMLDSLPFRDAAFDGVVCECVLAHTPVRPVLRELARVLRPAGFLVISDMYRRRPEKQRAAGPMGINRTIRLLGKAGLRVMRWEDRTDDLKRLAVRLIMEHGSLKGFALPGGEAVCRGVREAALADLGYYLLVARRTVG
ncbi:MAG: DVU_1556 family methyltransferase [Syntrophorhabdales bacterium]